jgi:hypothetical protein
VSSDDERSNPRFPHHCEGCVFLGIFREHDLYFCEQGMQPSVNARYGATESEYTSSLTAVDSDPMLDEAAVRAMTRGLAILE